LQDYLTAILEKSTVTERYHGIAFKRELTVRTMYGKSMTIHDMTALSNDLQTGKRYNFIIAVNGVERVRAFTHSKSSTARLSGTIRALTWEANQDKLQVWDEDWLETPMAIIGTIHGQVLLSRMLLGGVVVGNAVTWGKDRFELVGVYK
jgi:hypothetical protein